MAQLIGTVRRNWQLMNPPVANKSAKPLRFGILGASSFAPTGFISPAKSHPDIVVQAVAARDPKKAAQYAAKHGIPQVKASYQELLDDPVIDCVYIPLVPGHHYEWALKALKAGKHVYLEKPSVSTGGDAEKLFHHAILSSPPATGDPPTASPPPVLLEAYHYVFHPAWAKFKSLVTPAEVAEVTTAMYVPSFQFNLDDMRFNYDLGGGAMTDLGPYVIGSLRVIFGAEPESCASCVVTCASGMPNVDQKFTAKFRFPNGGVGEAHGDLKVPITDGKLMPVLNVKHKPLLVTLAEASGSGGAPSSIAADEEIVRTRSIHFNNFVLPSVFHSIRVDDVFSVRKKVTEGAAASSAGAVMKTWKVSKTHKAYTFKEIGIDRPGEAYWTSWRYSVGQFVAKVRGEQSPSPWWTGEDSIGNARMIDMAYEKSGLGLRPASKYTE